MKVLYPSLVLFLNVFVSCRTPSSVSSMTSTMTSPPAKPGDLPKTAVNFNQQDSVAIHEHGSAICKILEKDKNEDLLRLSRKVCDSDASWVGYGASDALKNQNELFIANRSALVDVAGKISAGAAENKNVTIQRLVAMELNRLQQDLILISGEKIQKFEREIENPADSSKTATQRAEYTAFNMWPKQLNLYYMKNEPAH